jgi:hypothetical protein
MTGLFSSRAPCDAMAATLWADAPGIQLLWMAAAVTGVSLALFLWVALARKSRRPRRRAQHIPSWQGPAAESSTRQYRHRRQRHRKGHALPELRRNPTLAERGGLPPRRPLPSDPPDSP